MNITVFCGATSGGDPRFSAAARDLGAWIGRAGHALVYGGSSVGLMGDVSRSALAVGAKVIGVEPRFFIEAGVAQHDLSELIVVETMAERKAKMFELGDAFVALPGGFGTLEEMAEALSRVRLGLLDAPCFVLNVAGCYDAYEDLVASMLAHGFIDQADADHVRFPRTVEALAGLLHTRPN